MAGNRQHPENENMGTRKIPFSRELYNRAGRLYGKSPKKYFRLTPGGEIRLKSAYIIKCERVIKDEATGEVTQLICSYDPDSKSGGPTSGRKIKGTSHWVSASHAVDVEVRLYENLFTSENPDEEENYKSVLNPNSIEILTGCKAEPALKELPAENKYQFLRQGYFCQDLQLSRPEKMVFNRIVSLRDTWAKVSRT
jgi:glutaminyl-tRNA synthetase